jgi:16S rRNA (cytosine1402-N4)-methyltransferase
MKNRPPHTPVMREEFLKFFSGRSITTFFDGTVGAGGHARALLEEHPEIQRYLACDRDPLALTYAAQALEPWKKKIEFIHGNFAFLDEFLEQKNLSQIDGFFLISESLLCN